MILTEIKPPFNLPFTKSQEKGPPFTPGQLQSCPDALFGADVFFDTSKSFCLSRVCLKTTHQCLYYCYLALIIGDWLLGLSWAVAG